MLVLDLLASLEGVQQVGAWRASACYCRITFLELLGMNEFIHGSQLMAVGK